MSSEKNMKVMIMGSRGVGKTSLLIRELEGEFPIFIQPNVGLPYRTKTYSVDGIAIRLELWELASAHRFNSLDTYDYSSARGISLGFAIYDVTNKQSFKNVKLIVEETQRQFPDCQIVLIGNKNDANNRVVTTSEGQAFAQQSGILFHEVSAKTGLNINNAIQEGVEFTYRKLYSAPKPPATASRQSFWESFNPFKHSQQGEQLASPKQAGPAGLKEADPANLEEKKDEVSEEIKLIKAINDFGMLFRNCPGNELTDEQVQSLFTARSNLPGGSKASQFASAYRNAVLAEYLLTHHMYPKRELQRHGITQASMFFRFTHLQPAIHALRSALASLDDPSLTDENRQQLSDQLKIAVDAAEKLVDQIQEDIVIKSLKLANVKEEYIEEIKLDIFKQVASLIQLAHQYNEWSLNPRAKRQTIEPSQIDNYLTEADDSASHSTTAKEAAPNLQ
ncbi:MAG: ras-related protein RABE1a-like [Gammaproteobacteria bacterium]|jgi:small GTP-binding protein|nr:ras-related protein RABE1a-like [Gammaproteobacteria bacterium]